MSSVELREKTATWRVGDAVEVRDLEEILATLDDDGALDGLPFMPEMVKYCGQKLTVGKVAHKACDTASGKGGMRRMADAVHLADVRCDGSAHGGCQAACLMYWKTAWLRRLDRDSTDQPPEPAGAIPAVPQSLQDAANRPSPDDSPRYRCQITELLRAAPQELPLRMFGQYIKDVKTGNASVAQVARAFLVGVYNQLEGRIRAALPTRFQHISPGRWGAVEGHPGPTPSVRIDLQPGERVRIRTRQEVAATINERHLNRGLGFDPEMARFCGRTARVERRVDRIIDEGSGQMLTMKEPCIVLDGVVCEGAYTANCPRLIPAYWREIWLERIEEPPPIEPVSIVS